MSAFKDGVCLKLKAHTRLTGAMGCAKRRQERSMESICRIVIMMVNTTAPNCDVFCFVLFCFV